MGFGLIACDVLDLDPGLPFGARVVGDLIGVRAGCSHFARAGASREQGE